METATIAPVTFTKGAINEIKRLMNEDGFDASQFLRVGEGWRMLRNDLYPGF